MYTAPESLEFKTPVGPTITISCGLSGDNRNRYRPGLLSRATTVPDGLTTRTNAPWTNAPCAVVTRNSTIIYVRPIQMFGTSGRLPRPAPRCPQNLINNVVKPIGRTRKPVRTSLCSRYNERQFTHGAEKIRESMEWLQGVSPLYYEDKRRLLRNDGE